ncbi:prevent-host-death family protein [Microbacteriaceae bacterium SG_E_30_P1]|uniref:Antitoxin n=1 Tax=Antiquaquibacter oligotrophicus TaxID=2880260 RepID=A0ABT6KKN4_9MICO|nr:type II toxin-antitoxin system prevent-host-death family antitoxin [Antiquaquibacter oligotrophicus]MDH6180280.1 prevent-host-death family protein [Antiquaquibacter oligotrophicus]UDF13973.1 type II toxin-antitoxin system prevent-host-death family antitoxin [Antiquaquibacter oligotrophicus]
MDTVGLRELKQNPSAVVARAERGETITITVQGRPAARLVPIEVTRRRWVPADELAAALAEVPADATGWAEEAYAIRDGDPLVDPWQRSS